MGKYNVKQIYDELKEHGYDGSYSTVKRYLSKLFKEKDNENIKFIRSKCKKCEYHEKWIFNLLQGKISFAHLEKMIACSIDSESAHELYRYILSGSLRF